MIDLASFFTTQNTTTPASQIGAGQGALTPELAALQLISLQNGGLNQDGGENTPGGPEGIFALLLQQIEGQTAAQANQDQLITPETKELLQSDNPALAKKPKLDLIELLAANDEIAEEVTQLDKVLGLDIVKTIEHTLSLNKQLFEGNTGAEVTAASGETTDNNGIIIDIASLTANLVDPETGAIDLPKLAEILQQDSNKELFFSNDISALAQKIESFIEKADPALLSTLNITPEQLTTLQNIEPETVLTDEQVQAVEEIAEKIIIGLVAIVPPAPQVVDVVIPQQALKNSGKPASLDMNQGAQVSNHGEALLSRLSSLIVEDVPQKSSTPLPLVSDDGADLDPDFEMLLKDVSGKKYAGNPAANTDAANIAKANNTQNNTPVTQPAFNVLQAWPFGDAGSLYGSATYSDQIAEQLGLSLNGLQSATQGSLTSLINNAPASTTPHPTTQAVAASIQKSAATGETNISLQLDPPELGRVEVQMTFKDKTVKAIVTAEKPETHMMLQRDAQVLERALQEAGLDADGGLSFELAEHGFDFDQHNQRGGGHDEGGTGSGLNDGEEVEIIESTMTWHVDPETGHTRYDLWV